MYYRSAAQNLAVEAAKLADIISDASDDLIECQFARIRVAYAKCKGANATLLTAVEEPHGLAPLDSAGRNCMTQDLMALTPAHDKARS